MAVLALQIAKRGVEQIGQLVVMEIGLFFLATGLTTPPAQGALGPDPDCTAKYGYYKTVYKVQTFEASTIFLAVLLFCGLKLYTNILGELETVVLPKWKVYCVRAAYVMAVIASGVATVLAAIVLYVLMLVKVGMDKEGCLPGALKPILICVFVFVGGVAILVHGFMASVVFKTPPPAP